MGAPHPIVNSVVNFLSPWEQYYPNGASGFFMAYRFKLHEPIDEGIRRIVGEQVLRASQELDCSGEVPPTAIHNTRKAIKRLRALLRLARSAFGARTYHARDASLRDIAAALSSTRDDDVIKETIGKLETHFGDDGVRILAPLQSQVRSAGVKPRFKIHQAREISERLARENELFAKLDFHADLSTLERGLQKSYGRAVKALAGADDQPEDEAFHDLRKTVQCHWRQMALMSRGWPEYFKVRVDAARDLSQILGDEHDLSMLRTYTAAQKDLCAGSRAPIARMARARQEELRHEALSRAKLLLPEPAKPFAKRMTAYWATGRDLEATVGRDQRKLDSKNLPLLAVRDSGVPTFIPKAVDDQRSKRRA